MQLTVYNGSPRKRRSNSEILLRHFLEGFKQENETVSINYLCEYLKMPELVGKFQNAENIIICFPLYTDAMPGQVMNFIENLEHKTAYQNNQRIGFIIHCGFPESIHLQAIEQYLIKLAKRLNIEYIGTVFKPGSEGLRTMPRNMNKKLFNTLKKLGENFRRCGEFDKELLKQIRSRDKFPFTLIPLIKTCNKLGIFNIWWNKQLKKNNVYTERFAKPFEIKNL